MIFRLLFVHRSGDTDASNDEGDSNFSVNKVMNSSVSNIGVGQNANDDVENNNVGQTLNSSVGYQSAARNANDSVENVSDDNNCSTA